MVQLVSTRPEEIRQEGEKELADLMVRIAAADQAALSRLYDITSSTLFGLILRIVRQPEAAEEVTVDVYNQVWNIWNKGNEYDASRSTPWAWMLVMARSRALDSSAGYPISARWFVNFTLGRYAVGPDSFPGIIFKAAFRR
jgi:RNA polymerase sigma-70 factor (ECF subfamily)